MKTIFINDLEKTIREDLKKINTDTIDIYTSYSVIKYSKEEYLESKIDYCKDLLSSIKINQLECSVCYDRDNIDFYFINNENEYIYNNDNSCYMVIEEEKTEENKR